MNDESKNTRRERFSLFEKHAQTVIVAVILGLVLWVGATLATMTTDVAVLNERVSSLQYTVENFASKPRFTKEDFVTEMKVYDSRIAFIEVELQKRSGYFVEIDTRLRALERKIPE